jgi:hypothetical protein
MMHNHLAIANGRREQGRWIGLRNNQSDFGARNKQAYLSYKFRDGIDLIEEPEEDIVPHLPIANSILPNDDLLKQLEFALSHTTNDFRHTDLYKLLKDKLSGLGYWKAQGRGNPRKGYNKSGAAQQQAEFKRMTKESKKDQTNFETE